MYSICGSHYIINGGMLFVVTLFCCFFLWSANHWVGYHYISETALSKGFKMKLQLLVNDDVEYQLSMRLQKNKKLTPTKLINQILSEWCQDNDSDQYEKSLPNALKVQPKGDTIPHPNDAMLDVITIGELKTYVDAWHKTYGADAILENPSYDHISYRLTQ